MSNLDAKLGELCARLPALSPGGKQTAAKIIPWLLMGFGTFGFLTWLSSLQAFFAFSGLAQAAFPGGLLLLSWLTAPLLQLLAVISGYLLLQQKPLGWQLAFYSLLAGAIISLLSVMPLGLLLHVLFGYFLLQIREFYREQPAAK
ncbi:hypothetical protein [Sporomusa sphaeroides]|uniref:Chromate transporter n=1 Tax=Sporomusa sphaeroides DSM 2875 TaxID=1337886 RepID=A0ABP2C495_9FIRM|nr:hypothetical protein [Sporomusa sphaeroides]OLS56235.1 hypothetical protein SPSPH_26260 [Sporomusa sphaeroides DSM 2875]CVK19123.1 hypothetical protein SSPH_01770 [Sporomusa sphaeroides DSM 2875]